VIYGMSCPFMSGETTSSMPHLPKDARPPRLSSPTGLRWQASGIAVARTGLTRRWLGDRQAPLGEPGSELGTGTNLVVEDAVYICRPPT
jgi:hypothetical protein